MSHTPALTPQDVSVAIEAIREHVRRANGELWDYQNAAGEDWQIEAAAWFLEAAYIGLIVLAEALGLAQLRASVDAALQRARSEGLKKFEDDPGGDPHLAGAGAIHQFLYAIEPIYGARDETAVTRDLEEILRACTYSVTDPKVHAAPPRNERELHLRIENVLRCIFPDLQHKHRIARPIKNFEPDTGLRGRNILIEYKFISAAAQASTIADEILADTRAYPSTDWKRIIFVIYETARFRSEPEWRSLLRSVGVPDTIQVVVLSGEATLHDPALSALAQQETAAPAS